MFCKHCGKPLDEGVKFCPNCGVALDAGAPADNPQPVVNIAWNDAVKEKADSLASSILTFGILGLAFTATFYLSLLGLIFSCVALNKAKTYINLVGDISGKAAVGRALARPGMIVGIIYTALLTLVVLSCQMACIGSI